MPPPRRRRARRMSAEDRAARRGPGGGGRSAGGGAGCGRGRCGDRPDARLVGGAAGRHRRGCRRSTQRFEAAIEAVREAAAVRAAERAAEEERRLEREREQADRVAVCEAIEGLDGADAAGSVRRTEGEVGRPAADSRRLFGGVDAPVSGRLPAVRAARAAPRRWPKWRRRGWRRWPASWSNWSPSDQPLRRGDDPLADGPPGRGRAARDGRCQPGSGRARGAGRRRAGGEGARAPAGPGQAGAGQLEASPAAVPAGGDAGGKRAADAQGRGPSADRHP